MKVRMDTCSVCWTYRWCVAVSGFVICAACALQAQHTIIEAQRQREHTEDVCAGKQET